MVKQFLCLFFAVASAHLRSVEHTQAVTPLPSPLPYRTLYFEEDLDHLNRDPGKIKIRVLQVISPYSTSAGPLIIYTGNEGPIDQFYSMTGFLTTQIPNYWNCSIYFLEHRYYGESIPSPLNWEYLNTDQVLYDYADIIQQLKPLNSTPVIVFGGSYGGMLAAWMRMKYPHIVDGAIASSAPVLMGLDSGGGYAADVSEVLKIISPSCSYYIQQSFSYLAELQSVEEDYPMLSDMFHSCSEFQSPDDIVALETWLVNGYEGVVQSNYPGASNVDMPFPSWPANQTCNYFINYAGSQQQGQWELLSTVADAMNMIYNYSGSVPCFNITGVSASVMDMWTYQTCTELYCPQGTTNITDIFPPQPWDAGTFVSMCESTYGVTPRPLWLEVNYGMGTNYQKALKYASNIAFMNGAMDPWRYGCIQNVGSNANLYTHVIAGGAHHTDLRAQTPDDTADIIAARQTEINLITNWINEKNAFVGAQLAHH